MKYKGNILRVAAISLFLTLVSSEISFCSKPISSKEIGLQMYSVRKSLGKGDAMASSFVNLVDTLVSMGYTSAEAANYKNGKFYGMTPEQYRETLESRGMKPLSSHTTHHLSPEELESGDFSKSLEWWDKCIADHKAAGMEYIVTPSLHVQDQKTLDLYCRYYNEIGKKCNAAGIKYGYHNHSHEFNKINDTDKLILDYMIENTDPDKVFYQLDVYWTVMGKASPVDYFKRYPGRFKLLHIKDRTEVGQSGMVGFDAIFDNAGLAGVENIIVETEGSSFGDILGTVQQSIDYLKNAPFVKSSYSK